MSDLSSVAVSAFVDAGVDVKLDPPQEYEPIGGGTAFTNWILRLGDRNEVRFHFRDKADLWRLVDEITAKAGPR